MEDLTTMIPFSYITQLGETFTNTTEHNNQNHALTAVDYISLVVYSLAFLLGTIGNGLVIWFTVFKMKKTVNVIWFLNLAIADFLFTLFLPLSIIYLANSFYWLFGNFMCKLNSMVAFINLYASVFLLTAISMDRCASVIIPVWCQNHRTPRLAYFVVIAVWIMAFILSLPYFIFRDTYQDDEISVCYNNFDLEDPEELNFGVSRHKATVILRFVVAFIIPFSIIVTCYSVIAFRIHKNHLTTSSKPFNVIIAVIITFFLCWLPYHIFSFLELHAFYGNDEHLPKVVRVGMPLTTSLAFTNSCVNPFLYVFIGRDFQNKFGKSILSIFEKAFNEESEHKDLKSKTKSTSESQII
ncbi:chemerin-like receptor 1 [Anomaloglossus baeobatrachus]|uniref:chemerin-like receptor 1 n=1 Tax=Anomaloglossus baeobatrachus TaxID=238106 RepID=UPI003F4F9324